MSETLLPNNATPQEVALEQATARISAVPVPIRHLWTPDSCPAHLLPWLAWALSVDVWDASWSEARKRAVLRESLAVHRHKGTVGALRRALDALGFQVAISEWFEFGGAPHTFRIDAFGADVFDSGFALDAGLFEQVDQIVQVVKPARAHYDLRVGETFTSRTGLRAGLALRQRDMRGTDLTLRPFATASGLRGRTGTRLQRTHGESTIPAPRPSPHSTAAGWRSALRLVARDLRAAPVALPQARTAAALALRLGTRLTGRHEHEHDVLRRA